MKLNKIAVAVILNLSFFTSYAQAYNEDLFGNDVIEAHNNNVKKAASQNHTYNDNLLEDHTIDSKVIKEQLAQLNTLKSSNKPKAVMAVKKDDIKNKNEDSFVVTKEKIAIPADNSRNKIQLEEIPDTNLPAILGPAGEVDKWVKVEATSQKPVIKKIAKSQDSKKKEDFSDSNANQFFGINQQIAQDTSLSTASKSVKEAPSITLPVNLTQDLKDSLSAFNGSKPASMKTTNNTNAKTPSVKPKVDTGNMLGTSGTIKQINEPLVVKNDKTEQKPAAAIRSMSTTTSAATLPVSAIPIAGTAKPYFNMPKAINGNKIAQNLIGKEVYIQVFKQEHSLELYVKQDGMFKLANIYNICTFSGGLGPKVRMGDNKSPEGFYSADMSQMQPNSNYYKAINIGFPNAYDRANGYTGKFLMIHGSCVSAGCYAMTNAYIKEIYSFVDAALKNGQSKVNISIYPFRMTDDNMRKYRNNSNYAFWKQLKPGYDYFQATHQSPDVSIEGRQYVVNKQDAINTQPTLFAKN